MAKNNTVFDKLYFPKKPNYELVSEYFASKATDAQRALGRYNNGDDVERNVEITNYLVRRALDKTTKKLETKRNDYHDKRKIVQEQWKDLAQKEASLRENFIKFNQFVKENQEKKERAAIKIVEQNQLKEKRQIQIEELMEKCKEISDTKLKMDKNIAKYQIYEEFLLKVIEKEESMQTINDLLMRYEALVAAKKELNDVQQRDIMKLEKAKSSLNHLIEKYSVKVATLNNRIDCSKQRYEHAQHESAKWEKVFQNIQSETTEILLDVVTIKDTCRRMYMEICRRKNLKTCYTNKVEKQLLIIKQTIGEFEIINRKIKDIEELRVKESIENRVSTDSR